MHNSTMAMLTGRKKLKNFQIKPMFILLGLFILCGFNPALLEADESTGDRQAFSDLNGDGIRDNSLDTDNDGLPDFEIEKLDGKSEQDDLSLFSLEISEPILIEDLLTREEKFKQRQFRARAHMQNRGEFGAASSGPGTGITGAVSGACPGGVCNF